MNDINLKAIRLALESATPGPWRMEGSYFTSGSHAIEDHYNSWLDHGDVRDQDLIILLRNSAEAMLSRLERAERIEDLAKVVRAMSPSEPCVTCGVGAGEVHDSNCAAAHLDAVLGEGSPS